MTRISNIYHKAHADPPTGQEAQRRNTDACKRAWHEFGLVVLDPETITDEWTREAVKSEAIRQYGKRNGKEKKEVQASDN